MIGIDALRCPCNVHVMIRVYNSAIHVPIDVLEPFWFFNFISSLPAKSAFGFRQKPRADIFDCEWSGIRIPMDIEIHDVVVELRFAVSWGLSKRRCALRLKQNTRARKKFKYQNSQWPTKLLVIIFHLPPKIKLKLPINFITVFLTFDNSRS